MLRSAAAVAVLALLAAAPDALAAPTGTPATIASGLDTPWEVVPLPDGRVLVTEIPGRIRAITGGALQPGSVYSDAADPAAKYLGLAISPTYASDRFVYLYETRQTGTDTGVSRVTRLVDTGTTLTFSTVIFDGIASDLRHDGGRIAFGPDGLLYVTTGDIHDPSRPRNIDSLNGKILRMTKTGDPAPGNPFHVDGTESARDFVWSYGHRHPQGLAWDGQGRLWESEHGPSGEGPAGATAGRDELNLIVKGQDYGWPTVAGEQTLAGTVPPVVHSGPPPAWAPGGLAYSPDDRMLYAPMLNGQHLRWFRPTDAGGVSHHGALLEGEFGRLRAAVAVPGQLWLTTHSDPMRVLRVGMSSEPLPLGMPWPVSGPAPTTTTVTTTTAPAGTSLAGTSPSGTAPVSRATRASLLARRLRAALTTLRLRGLLRRGSVGARAGGFDSGSRLTVRLLLRRPGRPALTAAIGQVRPASRAPVTVRVRLGRRGRAALRRATTARLTFRVSLAPPDGAAVTRTATATIRR